MVLLDNLSLFISHPWLQALTSMAAGADLRVKDGNYFVKTLEFQL